MNLENFLQFGLSVSILCNCFSFWLFQRGCNERERFLESLNEMIYILSTTISELKVKREIGN